MKKFAFAPLFAIALIVGCQDDKVAKQQPVEPDVPAISADIAGETGTISFGESTVCGAYRADLEAAKAEGDAEKVATFETIIADACEN